MDGVSIMRRVLGNVPFTLVAHNASHCCCLNFNYLIDDGNVRFRV